MKVKFLKDFVATTTSGSRSIVAGTVLDLSDDKACRLVAAGVAKAIDGTHTFDPNSLPYLDTRGRLVIPFDSPLKYRWWAGGQSIRETLQEIFDKRTDLTREQADEDAAIMAKYVQVENKPKGV